MKITIHQPEHLPWLGFFHKVSLADVYVVLDHVPYRRRYFQNRNKIRTKDGWQWLTVPLEKGPFATLRINEARIFHDDLKWRQRNIDLMRHSYSKAPHFADYWEKFSGVYVQEYDFLADMNINLLKFLFRKLDVSPRIRFSSQLKVEGQKGDLILNICRKLNAKVYVSGVSGRDYLDEEAFARQGIRIIYQEFHHPIYQQLYDPFMPCMSAVDLLFNYGPESLKIVKGQGVPVMEEVFQ